MAINYTVNSLNYVTRAHSFDPNTVTHTTTHTSPHCCLWLRAFVDLLLVAIVICQKKRESAEKIKKAEICWPIVH